MFKKKFLSDYIIPLFLSAPKKLAQILVAKSIMPAYTIFPTKGKLDPLRDNLQAIGGQQHKIESSDGVLIDTMFFSGNQPEKVILFAPGNGEIYEHNHDRIQFLLRSGASLLVFNPRGVGESHGIPSEKGLSEDVISLYEHLIQDRKIDPSSILLYGRSLGGGYGSLGAATIQKRYRDKKIHIVSERSFGSLTEGIYHLLGGGILGRSLAALAKKFGWTLNATRAWDEIKGQKGIIFHRQDRVIPYPAQIHSFLGNSKEIHSIEIKDIGDHHSIDYCHNRQFTPEEEEEIHLSLRSILNIS